MSWRNHKNSESKFECPECKTQIDKKDINNFITNIELIRIINSCFNIPEKKDNNENKAKSLKIISLGPSGVGKTSIFKRLIKDKYFDNYKMTLGMELSIYYIKYKNIKYKLHLWDTQGQERYNALTQSYLRNSDGVLFEYDLTRKESFDKLKTIYEEYKSKYKSKEKVIGVLIGNKSDDIVNRKVSSEEAIKFAEENELKYFETSAKEDKNIKKAIASLLDQIIESRISYTDISSPCTLTSTVQISSEERQGRGGCC